jgi:hypothetical protein
MKTIFLLTLQLCILWCCQTNNDLEVQKRTELSSFRAKSITVPFTGKDSRKKVYELKLYLESDLPSFQSKIEYSKNGSYNFKIENILSWADAKNIINFVYQLNNDFLINGFTEIVIVDTTKFNERILKNRTFIDKFSDLEVNIELESEMYFAKISNFNSNKEISKFIKILEDNSIEYYLL